MTDIGNSPAFKPGPNAKLSEIVRAAMPWSAQLRLPGARKLLPRGSPVTCRPRPNPSRPAPSGKARASKIGRAHV